MKLVVFGLDGAAFELLDSWTDEGSLPNIKRIKENGVYGDLEACLPPVTSPNWKCYSTGKNPGKLGIFWWENIDVKNKRVYYPFQRKLIHREIWDYLSKAGYKVGVIGTPLTYPPKKVNGFMISGGLDVEEENYTYPQELEKWLKKEYDFRVRPMTPLSTGGEKGYEETKEVIEKHLEVGKVLWEKYDLDFLQLSIFDINVLHHFLWDDNKTKECWEIIDKYIGEFIDKGINVILMSDHGSNKIEHVFNINTWLEQEGFLKTRMGSSNLLIRLGLNMQNLSKWARRFRFYQLKDYLPAFISRNIPDQSGEVKRESKGDKIDWEKSRAIASGQGPIYLNDKNSKEGCEKLCQKLIEKLDSVRTPDGKKVVKKVYRKEEIYNGEFFSEAPDLVIDQEKGVHIPGGVGKRGVFDFTERWIAENKKYGLFAFYGENSKNCRIDDIKILDLAPTILHMFDLPVPNSMDGRVLYEVFKEKSYLREKEVKKKKPVEQEKIKSKTKELKDSGWL